MTRIFYKTTLAFALLCVTSGYVNAGVMIDLSGESGSTTINYSISGSISTSGTGFNVGLGVFDFIGFGDITSGFDNNLDPRTGGVNVTSSFPDAEVHRPSVLGNLGQGDVFRISGQSVTVSPGNSIDFSGSGTFDYDPTFDALTLGTFTGFIRQPGFSSDFMLLDTDTTLTISSTSGNGVVPEPASLAIFGIGGLGMVGIGRRRKKKQLT